jgi:hypothetical protein
LVSDLQVFNLAVLPGTAFREEAERLGLVYQPRPPYYVLQTPTLIRTDLYGLMEEAQNLFDIESDARPPPLLEFGPADGDRAWSVDFDRAERRSPPPADRRAQAFTLWLRSARFKEHAAECVRVVRELLAANPFTTLQVILESTGPAVPAAIANQLSPPLLGDLMAACHETPTYLDKCYALQPGRVNGAKRLIVLLPDEVRDRMDGGWEEEVDELVTVVWRADAGASRAAQVVAAGG